MAMRSGPQELSPLRVRANHSRTDREMPPEHYPPGLGVAVLLAHTAQLPIIKIS